MEISEGKENSIRIKNIKYKEKLAEYKQLIENKPSFTTLMPIKPSKYFKYLILKKEQCKFNTATKQYYDKSKLWHLTPYKKEIYIVNRETNTGYLVTFFENVVE